MKYQLLVVSLCFVFLASCGGSSGSDGRDDHGSDNAGDDVSSASGGNVLSDGTVISPDRCVDESLSVIDADYDVFLDAPKLDRFKNTAEALVENEQSPLDIRRKARSPQWQVQRGHHLVMMVSS